MSDENQNELADDARSDEPDHDGETEAELLEGGEDLDSGESEGEGESEDPEQEQIAAKEKRKKSLIDRNKSLTKRMRTAEREAAELRQILSRLADGNNAQTQQTSTPQGAPAQAEKLDRPTLETCDYDEKKYEQAMADYTAQVVRAELAAQQKTQTETQQQQTQAEKRNQFFDRVDEFAAENPEYHDYVSDNTPVSTHAAEVIIESEVGPEIMLYLGKNEAVAKSIYSSSPTSQIKALAVIENSIMSEKENGGAEGKPSAKKSSAKDPVKVSQRQKATGKPKPLSSLSADDYAKARRAQRLKKGFSH